MQQLLTPQPNFTRSAFLGPYPPQPSSQSKPSSAIFSQSHRSVSRILTEPSTMLLLLSPTRINPGMTYSPSSLSPHSQKYTQTCQAYDIGRPSQQEERLCARFQDALLQRAPWHGYFLGVLRLSAQTSGSSISSALELQQPRRVSLAPCCPLFYINQLIPNSPGSGSHLEHCRFGASFLSGRSCPIFRVAPCPL